MKFSVLLAGFIVTLVQFTAIAAPINITPSQFDLARGACPSNLPIMRLETTGAKGESVNKRQSIIFPVAISRTENGRVIVSVAAHGLFEYTGVVRNSSTSCRKETGLCGAKGVVHTNDSTSGIINNIFRYAIDVGQDSTLLSDAALAEITDLELHKFGYLDLNSDLPLNEDHDAHICGFDSINACVCERGKLQAPEANSTRADYIPMVLESGNELYKGWSGAPVFVNGEVVGFYEGKKANDNSVGSLKIVPIRNTTRLFQKFVNLGSITSIERADFSPLDNKPELLVSTSTWRDDICLRTRGDNPKPTNTKCIDQPDDRHYSFNSTNIRMLDLPQLNSLEVPIGFVRICHRTHGYGIKEGGPGMGRLTVTGNFLKSTGNNSGFSSPFISSINNFSCLFLDNVELGSVYISNMSGDYTSRIVIDISSPLN